MSGYLHEKLFRSVDASSLAVFRILFGALMLFEAVNYGIFLCLDCLYRDTAMLFKYQYFEWVGLLPGIGLELMLLLMGLAATGVMLGYYYRLSAILLSLSFAYLFLLDQALYLNHFYLALLFAVMLIFIPANACWSLDAKRKPSIASPTVPHWGRLWLLLQLEIVLLFAGFVKLNLDWLNLEPMRLWMNNRSHDEWAIFQWLTQDWGIALASYSVIILHLLGAPLLLWRRTRLWVFLVYVMFHVGNAFVFNIGIFPWLTIAASMLVFDPDWPRQLWSRWRGDPVAGVPPVGAQLSTDWSVAKLLGVSLLCVWLLLQVSIPLRHFMAPGNVAWNEDGHRFSWRMKLRSKTGTAQFVAIAADGQRWQENPADYLNRRQTVKMACIPDLLWQFAGFVEQMYSLNGKRDIQVYVDTACSLNTRKPAALINRLVDLTSIPRDEPSRNWITPLSEPLPRYFF